MSDTPFRLLAKAAAQRAIDRATHDLAGGAINESEWQLCVTEALAQAYLGEDDPRWQSGFHGDAALWRQARELILDAIPANGSLLDVGCANGHLLESLDAWARERGLELSLYGLELNSDLARTARRRLPAIADRIYTGNVSDWVPPRRFSYVRTGLEYVPAGREPELLRRVLDVFVEPGGRVLVGPFSPADLDMTNEAFLGAHLSPPHIVSSNDRDGKTRHVAWMGK